MKKIIGTTLLLSLSSFALADGHTEYSCKNGTAERKIAVSYLTEGAKVPCEVRYTKEDGSSQVLWEAQNSEGYCESKAAAFVEKQRGWGWQCDGAHAEAEAPVAVDTEAMDTETVDPTPSTDGALPEIVE